MNKCKFCGQNLLDGTGAHIFSDVILCSGIYIEGKFKRGNYEAIAIISRKKVGIDYFGDSVLPEKREEILGRAQTDEEIEETSEHNFINKELVCRSCELKFGPVETYFAQNIYIKILESEKAETDPQGLRYFQFKEFDFWVSFIFVLINIWRASASKFQEWTLLKDDENQILKYLNIVLFSSDIDEVVKLSKLNYGIVDKFDFQLIVSEQTSGKATENLNLIYHSTDPYSFYINRLILLFSDNKFNSFEVPGSISKFISKESIIKSFKKFPELRIIQISEEGRKNVIFYFFNREWNLWVFEEKQELDNLLKFKLGRSITPEEVGLFDAIISKKLSNKELPTKELVIEVKNEIIKKILS